MTKPQNLRYDMASGWYCPRCQSEAQPHLCPVELVEMTMGSPETANSRLAATAELDPRRLYMVVDVRRRQEDLSWRELGAALRINPPVFSRLKRGTQPPLAAFVKLQAYAAVHPAWLLLEE